MVDLSGRVALVTGSGTGIGRGIAQKLAEQGAYVIINGRRKEPCRQTEDLIHAEGGKCQVVVGDISDSTQVEDVVNAAHRVAGRVDILVNNAGTIAPAPVDQMTDAQWDDVIRVNLKGPFLCIRAFVEPMRANRFGRVINIGSGSSLFGRAGNANYVAAKAGLIGLTMSVALEMAEWAREDSGDYTCNLIFPGFNHTDLTDQLGHEYVEARLRSMPSGRPIRTREDVGAAVAFLASDEASAISGTKLSTSAGGGICIAS